MALNLLVLLVGELSPVELRELVAELPQPPSRVHVVAAAVVGALDWLATADDDAQRRAEVRALEAEWTLAGAASVEGEAGDADPLQAVEDALRSFAADEIAIAGSMADEELELELLRFGLPVRRVGAPPRGPRSPASRWLHTLAGGRWAGTPFVVFVGVNAFMLLASVVASAVVLLVLWASGVI